MQTEQVLDTARETATQLLDRIYLGNSAREWLLAAAVFVVTLTVLLTVRWLAMRRLDDIAAREGARISEYLVAILRHTRYSFLVLLALAPALEMLELPERISTLVVPLLRLTVIIQVGLWMGELISLQMHRLSTRKAATDVASVTTIRAIGLLFQLVLWTLIFLLVLKNFGVDVTALLTTLGIAGIAAALAVQNILSDLLASLSIVLDKPFVVGDFIIVGDHVGTVEEIGLKTTRLRALSGERIILANSDLLQSRIRNFRGMTERRIVFTFGVEYGTPLAVVERIPAMVQEVVTAIDRTRFDRSHFQKYGDWALVFETVYYVTVPEYNVYMDIQQRINLELYQRVEALGARFALPTRVLRSEEGGTPEAGADSQLTSPRRLSAPPSGA